MVSAFLKAAAHDAQGLEPRERADRLARMKASIREGLSRPGGARLADDEVAAVLSRCRTQANGKKTDAKPSRTIEKPRAESAERGGCRTCEG